MPRLLFEKTGNAVWMSHLDLMRLMQRAFKRADLPLKHTQGFNPRPSVSIALPLSVGVESKCELLDFDLDGQSLSGEEMKQRLNAALVDGVKVLDVYTDGRKIRDLALLDCVLELEYDAGIPENGENLLTVHISSAMALASERDYPVRLLNSNDVDGCYLRKAPHSFGWDIMPRAVTAGIWREVRLEVRDRIYFEQAFISTKNNRGTFYYVLKSDRLDFRTVEIELEGSCGDSKISAKSFCKWKCGRLTFTVNNPKLWFPYGYGDANVYDCKARIYENFRAI